MADMTQPLAQAKAGDVTIAHLRELYKDEMVKMQEADSASQHEDGWMNAKDLLAGETKEAKMQDFITRTKALGAANAYIRETMEADEQRNALKGLPELPGGSPQFAGQPGILRQASELRQVMRMSSQEAHYRKMLETDEWAVFSAVTDPNQRQNMLTPGRALGVTKTTDYIPVLKDSSYTTGADGGILPTDFVGMPYPLLTDELNYIMVSEEPGSIIRYFKSRGIQRSTSGSTGDVRTRTNRLSPIHVINDATSATQEHKLSMGGIVKVAIEDLKDNGQFSERNNRQLDVGVKEALTYQVLSGDNTGQNWHGLVTQLNAGAPANIDAFDLEDDNQVPVVTTGNQEREPIAFFERLMAKLALRGCYPTVVFLDDGVWAKVRDSQRVLRNQSMDYERSPYGRIANAVPMCLSSHLPANTAIIVDARKCMEVILGPRVETSVSEHAYWSDGAIGIRRMLNGNVAVPMPLAGIKVTATNNLQAAS